MSNLANITYKDLLKKLRAAGFAFERQAKGSHEIWFNEITKATTTIPNHPGTYKKGTLKAIINQLGLTNDEFNKLKLIDLLQ